LKIVAHRKLLLNLAPESVPRRNMMKLNNVRKAVIEVMYFSKFFVALFLMPLQEQYVGLILLMILEIV